jgi:hypothetical protein
MSKPSNSGRIFKVKEGVHAGRLFFAYHKDQADEIRKAGKICGYVAETVAQGDLFDAPQLKGSEKKILMQPQFLQPIGMFD